MKKSKAVAFLILSICLTSCSSAQSERAMKKGIHDDQQNILIVYLSRTSNTKAVAEMIQSKVDGDLIELELITPYPDDYQEIVDQVAEENNRNFLPALKTKIDLHKYDTIFIGFPTWDMQLPPPLKTFLSMHDWRKKVIAPFNTNAGFGLGQSESQIQAYCSKGKITEIYSVVGGYEKKGVLYVMEGTKAKEVSKGLDAWLKKIR